MATKHPFRLTSANPPVQHDKHDTLALGRMKSGVRNATEADYDWNPRLPITPPVPD